MEEFNRYPFWTARFWHGMRLGDWLRLVARNGGRIHPTRWPMAGMITAFSCANSVGGLLQSLAYGRKIRRTELERPPVFIVGHWRSGTTLLHELMVCDERFSFPSTYACFAPHHFLVSQWWAARLFWFLVPKQRPMDNMQAGMDLPQEDEFALMNLGAPSPYLRMAFPQEPPCFMDYLEMGELTPQELRKWGATLRNFAQALTVRSQRRLVFKSPPHTGRVGVLAELFPGAKFVHISRHPYSLFPSTLRLWKALDSVQGLQRVTDQGREEYVLESLERMYAGYERQRESLAKNQLFEVRYEDLLKQPLETLESIYTQLELDDFAPAREAVTKYLEQRKDYQRTSHPELSEEHRRQIDSRWRGYMERYHYE